MTTGVLTASTGEVTLTFWLLVKGVNVERWNEQARATEHA